jgi:outer membrane receptor protein involved in Fe transport
MLIFHPEIVAYKIVTTKLIFRLVYYSKTKYHFMRKALRFLGVFTALLFSLTNAFAQSATITGNVKNATSKEAVGAVSVTVKGSDLGTFTNSNGDFKITVPKLPVTLVFSSVGFEILEVNVTDATSQVDVNLVTGTTLGQEVVVAATRTPQRILESPVSIERYGSATIRNAPAPDYYEIVKNLKGVDLTTSSLTFKTISTRGFNGSGNLRFNQLVDGIDNQAPGLNFAVGSIVGPTELDIDNVELLQGASSALYGSGGTNGTLLITSKSPFKYQGLSFQVRQGVNHVNSPTRKSSAPYYDWAFRWAKPVGDKFAFKIGAQFLDAQDWEANDTRNLLRNNVFSSVKSGDRITDPNYDGVNIFGDEASVNMQALALAARATIAKQMGVPTYTAYNNAINAQLTAGLTPSQIAANLVAGGFPASLVQQSLPFFIPTAAIANNPYATTFTNTPGSGFVSRTGYNEKDLVDYHAYNLKLSGGVNYKISNNTEASLLAYWGTGTTVYTGADRYNIKNLIMGQYKAEVKGRNWFLRGYTVQENSGDSYTATTAALFVNNKWKSNTNWFQQYAGTYSAARLGLAAPVVFSSTQAHDLARQMADAGRFIPGSTQFTSALNEATATTIGKNGAKFDDATDMYQFEGQYRLNDYIKVVDVTVGASYRLYSLNSNGSIFVDTPVNGQRKPIKIYETGGYIQLQKSFLNDALKLTGSARYDKHENFEGRFTPRLTALYSVAKNNNVRVSFQTAYRFPSNQDQYINLLTGGANRLIGGLPEFEKFFKFNDNPAYTAESVVAYRNSFATSPTGNPTLLKQAQFRTIKPERALSYELGYRGLPIPKLLIDGYVYYSIYKDFIGRTAVGRGNSGDPLNAPLDLASPFTTDNYSFVVNTSNEVKAFGWGIGGNYLLPRGFELSGNVSSDQLNDVPDSIVTFFNTPKLRFNLGAGNNNLYKGIGFNVQYRWQDDVLWQGTFGTGEVPAFGVLDAQVSYKLPKVKGGLLKFGASNLLNSYYRSAFGNPLVGAIYYASFGYNIQ